MKTGGFEHHLRKMTKLYQQRGLPISFEVPDGGMALWVDMGKSVLGLKEKLLAVGVYLQLSAEFNLGDKEANTQHIRIGFAVMSEQRAKEGLELIIKQ